MNKIRLLVCICALLGMMQLLTLRAQEEIVVDFAHIFGGEGDTRRDVIRAIADDFEAQNPGIRINLVSPSNDYTELFNRVLLDASQGNAPDVVQVEEGLTQLAVDSQFFVPIGDLATPEQLAQYEGILPVVRNYYTIGDKIWSIPWNSSNPVLYYNKSITDALGIQIPSEPMTFEQLLAVCRRIDLVKTLILNANPAYTNCINFPVTSWMPEQWMAMQNALLANNENGRSARATEMAYDSPEMLKIANFFKEMAEKNYFTYTGTPNNYNGEGALFGTGATVLHINSTAGITLFVNGFAGAGVDLGIAPLFIPDEESTNGVTVGGASLWVLAGKSEAETRAAVDWVFFLTNTQNDIRWHQGSGYFPNRQESLDILSAGGAFVDAEGNPTTADAPGAVEAPWFEVYPFFRIAIDQLQNSGGTVANAGAVIGPSAEVRQVLVQALQSIIDSGIAPEEALAAAQQQANAILADYNAVVGN
jgi:sn-glycerol 3-phosphate transport system substrate-binding protein